MLYNQLSTNIVKRLYFLKNWKDFYIETEAVKMFMKEQFCIVNCSIGKIAVKNENQESKEFLDLFVNRIAYHQKKKHQRISLKTRLL